MTYESLGGKLDVKDMNGQSLITTNQEETYKILEKSLF